MEIGVNFNLDDGFLRRECPNCERQFKWHHGPVDDRPDGAVDPPMYHCPYCGLTAANDSWWTPAQLVHLQEAAAGPAAEAVGQMLEDSFRNSKSITFKASGGPLPAPSGPPVEPRDMVAVASPCHAWEPIKVAGDWTEPLHCIVCGALFAI